MSYLVIMSAILFQSFLVVRVYYCELSMGSKPVGGITCVMHNLAMQTIVPLMYILKLSHRDIRSHTLTLLSELSGDLTLVVFQAKIEI